MKSIRARIEGFNSLFGTKVPIMAAPMPGVATPAMTAAVSNAGGLGVIAADFLSPDELSAEIDAVRGLTVHPFAVNLRIFPRLPLQRDMSFEAMRGAFSCLMEDLGCADEAPAVIPDLDGQIEVVLEKAVPALRVCFGGLRKIYADKLDRAGIPVIGAACTLREAKVQRSAGVSAVVVQGSEAGGPRLSFEDQDEAALVGLMSLIGPAARACTLPVIASGGIMTGSQMAAALAAGASAVEVGTLLLCSDESAAHPLHMEAVRLTRDAATVLTRIFSGRLTRVAGNGLLQAVRDAGLEPLPWPQQWQLMHPILKAAFRLGRDDVMELSAGQGSELAGRGSCAAIMGRLIDGLREAVEE